MQLNSAQHEALCPSDLYRGHTFFSRTNPAPAPTLVFPSKNTRSTTDHSSERIALHKDSSSKILRPCTLHQDYFFCREAVKNVQQKSPQLRNRQWWSPLFTIHQQRFGSRVSELASSGSRIVAWLIRTTIASTYLP